MYFFVVCFLFSTFGSDFYYNVIDRFSWQKGGIGREKGYGKKKKKYILIEK